MAKIKKADNTSSEHMKHLELSHIIGGSAKWYNHFEQAVSYKTQHTPTLRSNISNPRYFHMRSENICS